MSGQNGNAQAFLIATITIVGTFVYLLTVTVMQIPPDPAILPFLAGANGAAFSFFFSGKIANGAASKALDVLVATGKEREAALSAARVTLEAPTRDTDV